MNFERKHINPILHFRNVEADNQEEEAAYAYSLKTGTHHPAKPGEVATLKGFDYSTMLTRSREAVDSTEGSYH